MDITGPWNVNTEPRYTDFGVMCRVCLKIKDDFRLINSLNIIVMIQACSAVNISSDDGLPQRICENCARRVEDAYQLKELCEMSDKKLREILVTKLNDVAEIKPEVQSIKVESAPSEEECKSEVKSEPLDCNTYVDCCYENSNHSNSDGESDTTDATNNSAKSDTMKNDLEEHKCDKCDKMFNSISAISLHLVRKHNTQPFRCEKCDRRFFNGTQLKEHSQSECQLKCERCNKTFETFKKLKKHNMLHRPKEFHCFKCDSSFIFKWMLAKHDQLHHSGPRLKEECTVCGHLIMSSNMERHLKIHRERTPFSCSECPKTFIRKNTLKDHVMTVHRNEPIPLKQLCTVCGRSFRGKAELRRHTRSHTDERPFPCTYCEKRFRESKALKAHVLYIHKDIRSFPCNVCSKMFHTKSILKAHLQTHTGIRPFTCLACNKSFRSKTWLNTHIKSHSSP